MLLELKAIWIETWCSASGDFKLAKEAFLDCFRSLYDDIFGCSAPVTGSCVITQSASPELGVADFSNNHIETALETSSYTIF